MIVKPVHGRYVSSSTHLPHSEAPAADPQTKSPQTAPNLPTNMVGFRGFDSSIMIILRGEIPRRIGDFPESSSQAMSVGCNVNREIGRQRLTANLGAGNCVPWTWELHPLKIQDLLQSTPLKHALSGGQRTTTTNSRTCLSQNSLKSRFLLCDLAGSAACTSAFYTSAVPNQPIIPRLCRKRAARRQRVWGPEDRSGINTEIPNPANIERTDPKHAVVFSRTLLLHVGH